MTLTAPASEGGVTVTLASADQGVASVPSSVEVAAGQTTATFPVVVARVTAPTSVVISATVLDVTQSATLQIVLSAPKNGNVIFPSGLNYTTSSLGATITIKTSYFDLDGAETIKRARILIGGGTTASYGDALFAYYDAVGNKFYLYSPDGGGTYLGGSAPGSANVIVGPQGSLNCAKTSVVRGGMGLTINWSFSPNATFTGNKNVFLMATDTTNLSSPWEDKGDWLIKDSSNVAPQNGSVSPSSGRTDEGVARTLSALYSDGDGALDLETVRILVSAGSTSDYATGLYAYYEIGSNKLYLYNAGTAAFVGGFAPGSANIISGAAGSLNCALTKVVRVGNTLTVNWNFVPASGWTGLRSIFLRCQDKATAKTDWQKLGSWSIGANLAPVAVSLSPVATTSVVGEARNFLTSYRDDNGASTIKRARVLLVGKATPTYDGALFGSYEVATNTLSLYSQTSGTYIGNYAPGSAKVISVPAGSLNCAATTVVRDGNSLKINWNFTPSASFIGSKNAFLYVIDAENLSDGWKSLGSWTVTPVASGGGGSTFSAPRS